ncbi:MAG TPA: hemerythrin domain-containing protein [Methylomirabilota bacterium]|jgi:iron-sulfur cluster repair protein YtfE (RIC family)
MDAIQFLQQEHRKAKAAFAELLAAPPARRGALWKELQPELKTHEAIEEACLYGPIEEEHPADDRLSEWVSERHEEEVGEVEGLIKQTEQLDPTEDAWLGTVRQIHSALEHHIAQEEGEIFPRIGQVWDAGRLAKAGQEMTEMHGEKAARG